MLTPSSLPPAERRLYSQLRKVLTRPGLLRGNLVDTRRTCGKSSCRCRKGLRYRHRGLYLGLSLNGKPRMIYVPSDWEEIVRDWVVRYGEIRDLVEELSLACLKRLESRSK